MQAAEYLKSLRTFNRKERFFVVGWALGNPDFRPDQSFRSLIGKRIGLDIPSDAFCAMDFHMDWIAACLWLTKGEQRTYRVEETGALNHDQEDVDLLLAFEGKGTVQLVMIEAKGVTGWTNRQLEHKALRLASIFGADGKRWPGVHPHWLLASPTESKRIDTSKWPDWMREEHNPRWVPLKLPKGLRRIVRCDEDGHPNQDGLFWKIV